MRQHNCIDFVSSCNLWYDNNSFHISCLHFGYTCHGDAPGVMCLLQLFTRNFWHLKGKVHHNLVDMNSNRFTDFVWAFCMCIFILSPLIDSVKCNGSDGHQCPLNSRGHCRLGGCQTRTSKTRIVTNYVLSVEICFISVIFKP